MDMVLNWLWQGCVVALALVVMLGALGRARAQARYAVCWGALLLVVLLPLMPRPGWERHAAAAPVALPNAIVAVPDVWWLSTELVMIAWIVWAAIGAATLLRALILLRRARKNSRPFPEDVESQLRHWRQVRANGRRAALVVSDAVGTAAVLGAGAPMIAVAPALVERLALDELDRVLIHEWAHVQRRDDLAQMLQLLVHIVAGWHPAVRWLERRLHVEREIACDEAAVAVAGPARAYAECLVKLAGLQPGRQAILAAPAMRPARDLRRRVRRIVSKGGFMAPIWSRSVAAAIGGVLTAIAVGVASLPLVEASALATPIASIRSARAELLVLTPPGVPALASSAEPAPRSERSATSRLNRRSVTDAPVTAVPVPADRAEPPSAAPAPPATAADEPTTVDPPAPAPAASSSSAADATPTGIAERGVAIGRKSKDAGLATARAFTRFGRRIAASF